MLHPTHGCCLLVAEDCASRLGQSGYPYSPSRPHTVYSQAQHDYSQAKHVYQRLYTRLGHTIRTQLRGGKSSSMTVLLGKESNGAVNERLGFSQPALLEQQAACLHQHLEL